MSKKMKKKSKIVWMISIFLLLIIAIIYFYLKFLFSADANIASVEITEVNNLGMVNTLGILHKVNKNITYVRFDITTKSSKLVWGEIKISYRGENVGMLRIPYFNRKSKISYILPIHSRLQNFDDKDIIVEFSNMAEK